MPTKSRTAKTLRIAKFLIPAAIVAVLLCWLLYSEYEFVQLGSLGGTSGGAVGLNNRGQVVGWSETADGHRHAFLWDADNGMRDLGTLGGAKSEAWSINEKGQVVGASETGDGSTHAFIWDANKGMIDLGTLGGKTSNAMAINNNGQVVGRSETADGETHAFLWQRDAGMKDLHAGQAAKSGGADINDRGQIIGYVESADSSSRWRQAFYWDQASGMVMIPVRKGMDSYAVGINDTGQVIGDFFDRGTGQFNPFIWDKTDGLNELQLPGGSWFAGRANEAGAVIGKVIERKRLFFRPRRFAFLRKPSGRILYLERFAPAGTGEIDACDINDNGWIAGATGYKSHQGQRPILLRPRRLLRRRSNSPH